ncbi:MAG: PfkB family carbohydrate kinase, partial [Deinococcales bacterium]
LLAEPAASAIMETVALHRNRATIVLDPNVRPALIKDRDDYLKRLDAWLTLSHLVKISSQDIRWLYPERSFADIAQEYLAKGVKALIITQGEKGASLYRIGHEVLFVPSVRVEVVDTVGAGDTFTGTLMRKLLDFGPIESLAEDDWREVIREASLAAAFNCARAGANPPTTQELSHFKTLNSQ